MTALDFFLAHRVKVFPVQVGTKKPAVPAGTSWADWDDFVRPRPTGPYGVVLGDLMVLDADNATTAAWLDAHVPFTPFVVQSGPYHDKSPGRGLHRYFRAPQVHLPAFIHRDGLSFELKRRGHYVVGPGSPHPDGGTYGAASWSWDWNDLPVFPADFLFNDGTGTTSEVGQPYVPVTGDAVIPAGERTAELFRFVRSLKANGASAELTLFAVREYNQRCQPPKSDAWLRSWFPRAWGHRDQSNFGQLHESVASEVLF
ncbi:MAG TPA: bifunctional DNA primase/polymerase [Vicinamibacterales bacterium]|nr:bifunctional DNA primase/polymerase [Vicinamibacterales bacterium]